jgi:LPS export ABC transporter protein LptC
MKQSTQKLFIISMLCLAVFALGRCTFDYGDSASENDDQADIVMGNVEYVRMRDGDPVVRFRAQQAERYENRQTMELQNFSFEQFYDHGNEINAAGSAGIGLVELDSGNIQLEQSIIIAVDSEDITIETDKLSWEDEKRILAGSDDHTVDIQRSDGTVFSGRGFSADSRRRTWTFTGGVEGSYVDTEIEDENGEEEGEGGETEAPLEEELFRELEGELDAALVSPLSEESSDAVRDDS